ncbi:hypothetical protein M406DRAFT_349152 [Cryphonectria parasitica EP155]|uniref:F-box domain-containing protein n=1 Tax=Cryphonectria parasitica (strain ATCC 38755 / EP155) TaxID=660469 RepID=A0A9P4YBI2_CRYP1|nr:uncharacterized protein M406DRAFT_349152 [Cryphonectria parasitica EP155]KAF3770326.1 hypothetical protein M406DRAFT_349152 [Cryphonectria parasitica EP155]
MVRLRSKLHLSRQGRKSSLSHASSLPDQCNAVAIPVSLGASGFPSSSRPDPILATLPEELLVRVTSFCDFSDILRLRRSCRALRLAFGQSSVIELVSLRLMDPHSTRGTPSRDVLLGMIKTQLDAESRDEAFRRDIFLCLAVTLPPRQRSRIKQAFGSVLARARVSGSGRDPGRGGDPSDLHDRFDDDDNEVSAELETRLGVVSTLLVLGYSDVCDLAIGRQLMAINHWSAKSDIWAERRLLKHKEISLQLAFSMVLGLLNPSAWSDMLASGPIYQTLAQRVKSDFRGAELTSSSQSFWLSWEGLHTRSLQLAALIAYILRTCGFEDVPRSDLLPLLRGPTQTAAETSSSSSSSSSSSWCTPPVPLLENFSEDGIRAHTSSSWQDWYAARTRDLVNAIEDGEWYGYYIYTLEDTDNISPTGQRDPAMENVHFKLGGGQSSSPPPQPPPPPPPPLLPVPSAMSQHSTVTTATSSSYNTAHPTKVPLEARGAKDGITGDFDFVGTVNTNSGVVSMRKRYRGAHYWDYDGVMTPLGIVGEWGREGHGFDGYFWLWKRSWMVHDAVPRTVAYYS